MSFFGFDERFSAPPQCKLDFGRAVPIKVPSLSRFCGSLFDNRCLPVRWQASLWRAPLRDVQSLGTLGAQGLRSVSLTKHLASGAKVKCTEVLSAALHVRRSAIPCPAWDKKNVPYGEESASHTLNNVTDS